MTCKFDPADEDEIAAALDLKNSLSFKRLCARFKGATRKALREAAERSRARKQQAQQQPLTKMDSAVS